MKVYKKLTYVSAGITVVSAIICIWLHYTYIGREAEFWINVNLALFGSATLTLLTSLLTYYHERRKTLENFQYHTDQILARINIYQESMMLEEKIKFFLDYHDIDKIMWDSDYGNMDFFFECINHNRRYIYQNIYMPIIEFGKAVNNHVWHFRGYLNGNGKNECVMQQFVTELEEFIIKKTEFDMPVGWDEKGVPTAFCKFTDVEPRLVLNVKEHLVGHHYDIMYGKRRVAKKYKKEMKVEQAQNGAL